MAAVPENIPITDDGQKRQEEMNFHNLKSLILDVIIKSYNVDEDAIREAIPDINDSFKEFRRNKPGRNFASVDFEKWPYACGFVHKNGGLGMSLTRFKVLQALEKSHDLKIMLQNPVVNVVCIGGGAGTDVVGLTSALRESGIRSDLNITIVDSVERWSSFVDVLEAFIRDPKRDFGNASQYFRQNNVDLSFIRAKLPFDGGESQDVINAKQAIGNADVILMMRFIESVEENKKPNAIQHVRENMKDGAIALVIDSPFYEDNSMWDKFERLYVQKWVDDRNYFFHISAPPSDSRFGEVAPTSKALVAVFRRNMQHEANRGITPMARFNPFDVHS